MLNKALLGTRHKWRVPRTLTLAEQMNIQTGIMVIAFATTRAYASDVSAPSPQEMATLINYDHPITLVVKEDGPIPSHEWGNLIRSWSYTSKTQTLYSYHVTLFAGGTLFGTNRMRMENHIIEAEAKLSDGPNRDFAMVTMPDGHKVYYAGLAFGPGGALMGGFSTLPNGQYDLLVTQSANFEDDMPQEQKLKGPAKPLSTLQEIYPRVEAFFLNQIRNNESSQQAGPAYPPQGVGSADP